MPVQNIDEKPSGSRRDPLLFGAHDAVNLLVLLVVFGLPYVDADLLVHDYRLAKILHLLGLGWFFGGLIVAPVAVSRFIWLQPSLDHEKLAHGFRFLLVVELLGLASIALIAYGGIAMAAQLGGLESQPWARQGYLAVLFSPVILMITPRLYHKRLIKNPHVDIRREKRLAFWLDSSFIVGMAVGIGALVASMVRKVPLF